MTDDLAKKECAPCRGGIPALRRSEIAELLEQLGDGWTALGQHHLEREFRFKDFREALAFANKVGEIAEEQGHHPDMFLGWGRLEVMVWTHKVNGLTESDFIFAAKVSAAHASRSRADGDRDEVDEVDAASATGTLRCGAPG